MPTPSFGHRDKYTDGYHPHDLSTHANILHYWEYKETLRNSYRMTSLDCVSIWLDVLFCVFYNFAKVDILCLIAYSTWKLGHTRPRIANRQVIHLYNRLCHFVFLVVGRTKMFPVLKLIFG